MAGNSDKPNKTTVNGKKVFYDYDFNQGVQIRYITNRMGGMYADATSLEVGTEEDVFWREAESTIAERISDGTTKPKY